MAAIPPPSSPISNGFQLLKERICSCKSRAFPLRVDSFLEGFWYHGSHKSVSLGKKMEKYRYVPIYTINMSILTLLHSERPPFLSAIGLRVVIVFLMISAEVEENMKYDRLLSAHYRYYVREMRIVAYSQLLESYSSLTLEYMANAFGVTVHFIDQ